MTKRWAAMTMALLLVSIPAAAAVITQNFIQADVTASAACFVKVAGADEGITNGPASVNLTTTHVSSSTGLVLLQEQVSITAYQGDRVSYYDLIRYQNNCAYDVIVELVAEADAAGNASKGGDWTDMEAQVYVSNVANAVASVDFTDGTWEGPIIVDELTGPSPTRIGAVTTVLSTGDFLTTGVMTELAAAGATTQNGILRYTATATATN